MMHGQPKEPCSNVYQAIRTTEDAGVTVTITVHENVESGAVSGINWPRVAQDCEALLQRFSDGEFEIEDDEPDHQPAPSTVDKTPTRPVARPRA